MAEVVEEGTGIALVPRVDKDKLSKIDQMSHDVLAIAEAYRCQAEPDFVRGGEYIASLRSIDGFYNAIYTPIKQAMDSAKAIVLGEEKGKRVPLALAKKAIEVQMIAWKAADDKAKKDAAAQEMELARARAQESALQEAVRLTERAEATGNTALAAEAERVLERPLQVTPVIMPRTPVLSGGVKVVSRLDLQVTHAGRALLAVAATMLYHDETTTLEEQRFLKPHYCSCARDLIPTGSPGHTKMQDLLISLFREEAKKRGTAFQVPGMSAGKKDGLG